MILSYNSTWLESNCLLKAFQLRRLHEKWLICFQPNLVFISAMRDRASGNNIAIWTIKSNVLEVGCFSNTPDLVKNYFKLPNLTEFLNSRLLLFSHSVKCKFFCGKSTLGKGWLLTARPGGGVNGKLCNKFWYSSLTSSHSCKKYRYWAFYKTKTPSFFDDSQNLNHLKIELAAIVDCGEVFVKATYNLEGMALWLWHATRQFRRSNLPYKLKIFQKCGRLPKKYHHPLQLQAAAHFES